MALRMSNRRFARKTNAHSKKVRNHRWMFAIHAMNYNFCRVHQTLKKTPAMAAGIASRKWTFADVVTMADQREADDFDAACEAAFAAGAWSKPASSSQAA